MDKNYSGVKWTAFNVGRDSEPRFAGMDKLPADYTSKVQKGNFFTFASRMGEGRTADLSKSLIAYFRGKLLEGDG